MASLAQLPHLVGFFSYSRNDDEGDDGAVAALANRIYRELRSQLGRTDKSFKLWRDKDALAAGDDWKEKLKEAVSEFVFFIQMVTPSVLKSPFCRFAFESFIKHEKELGRDDLMFPLVYVSVPELDDLRKEADPVLSTISTRLYLDWRHIREGDINSFIVREAVEQLCRDIVHRLRKPWVPSEEQQKFTTRQIAELQEMELGHLTEQEDSKPAGVRKQINVEQATAIEDKNQLQLDRASPEYWLHRVDVERKLRPGDQPLVLISFASDDQRWVDDLRDYLDAKMDLLRDKDGQPYQLWNYSDVRHGTKVGDEFPEIVAEKMWRCQAAILVFSRAYFRSDYCRQIELPFLLWRREHHNLMCLPIKIGTPSYDIVLIPNYRNDLRYLVFERTC